MGTLRLGSREETKTAPEHGIAFDESKHYAEVCGMDGIRYVQAKALFNTAKKYVRPAPESMWLAPLTKEQEAERQKKIQANKKFFGMAQAVKKDRAAELPKEIRDAERENARALAVEGLAA